ncbi:MAG: glycosyltransferase [Acidobacteriota bacterium]|nr:glycosyltransferase [Acidobacteriota bacterium]
MRILFVALTPPYPPDNGHRMRNWSLVRALAAEGHTISVVCFGAPEDGASDLAPLASICEGLQLVPLRAQRRSSKANALDRGRKMFSARPFGVFKYESLDLQKAVTALLRQREFDAILCDDVYLFKNLPPNEGSRTLLNKHDFTYVVVRRLLTQTHNPLKWVYGRLECAKLKRWEGAVSSSVASVLVCSDGDGAVLRQLAPHAKMHVVPNVIDVSEYAPKPESQNAPLLFFGAMDYHANQDAVEFFIWKIWPEITREFPQVKFVIAGRNPPEILQQRLARVPNVIFTGSVPDMRAEIAKCQFSVVPLRVGSGTRLKILEAGAMARPVVSTSIGAEGLNFRPGEEILLADNPAEFAQAVGRLLKDEGLRKSMGQAARKRVAKDYSIEALRSALRNALSAFAASKALEPDRAPSSA